MSEYPKNVSINKDAKSKFWYVSFISIDGKQKRRSTKVPVNGGLFRGRMLTARQAQNFALIEGTDIANKECEAVKEVNEVSVRTFLDGFLERRKPYVSKATYVNMKGAYAMFYDFLGKKADMPIRLVTRQDAKGFVEERRKEVRMKTVKKNVACIRSAFFDALDSEIIAKNPFQRISIDPDTCDEALVHDAFTLDEINLMIERFPGDWPAAIICCYETFGQRLGDIVSLKWSQFDFERRCVRFRTGKTRRELEQPMRDAFFSWAKARFDGCGAEPDDYVLPRLARLGAKYASIEFGQLLRLHDIGVIASPLGGKRRRFNSKTFHSIRATCATVIHASGISEGMAMKLVGHDSEVIHRGYVRPDVEKLREAAVKVQQISYPES